TLVTTSFRRVSSLSSRPSQPCRPSKTCSFTITGSSALSHRHSSPYRLSQACIFSNYLTGTIPPIPSSLVGLDVAYNFLSGSLPPHSLKFCAAENNCFSSSSPSSSCNFYGTKQRAAAECTVCGMGDAAAGNVCWDGVCTADAAAVASQGIPNGPTRPTLAMSCVACVQRVCSVCAACVQRVCSVSDHAPGSSHDLAGARSEQPFTKL
ncbi:unnamed protein product, partial [Closterium sp. NIES-65]